MRATSRAGPVVPDDVADLLDNILSKDIEVQNRANQLRYKALHVLKNSDKRLKSSVRDDQINEYLQSTVPIINLAQQNISRKTKNDVTPMPLDKLPERVTGVMDLLEVLESEGN